MKTIYQIFTLICLLAICMTCIACGGEVITSTPNSTKPAEEETDPTTDNEPHVIQLGDRENIYKLHEKIGSFTGGLLVDLSIIEVPEEYEAAVGHTYSKSNDNLLDQSMLMYIKKGMTCKEVYELLGSPHADWDYSYMLSGTVSKKKTYYALMNAKIFVITYSKNQAESTWTVTDFETLDSVDAIQPK
ncbi:MAG: outer membrane protein assembly factor BamE [Ruminococcaceae bacterium]|nr:outer membrane protein assembly factor BamE [Oscillospiraceae bacterium]